jgi:hypothetical protein
LDGIRAVGSTSKILVLINRVLVLLTNQKDYEHFILRGFLMVGFEKLGFDKGG